MQLLLIRHALPLRSRAEDGADPPLADLGRAMAQRLPEALRRHGVARILSSPQLRARQTAQPLADATSHSIEIDERFAEYDYGLTDYVPVEEMRSQSPDALARLVSGELPDGVDAAGFTARVMAGVQDLAASSDRRDKIAIFAHGGVINVLLGKAVHAPALFPFRIEYASISHLRYHAEAPPIVLGVNNIEHVWDLLPSLTKR
jgi:probable phosphoglycerate mutase